MLLELSRTVTRRHTTAHTFTRYMMLHTVTPVTYDYIGYIRLNSVTCCYILSQTVTYCHTLSHAVTYMRRTEAQQARLELGGSQDGKRLPTRRSDRDCDERLVDGEARGVEEGEARLRWVGGWMGGWVVGGGWWVVGGGWWWWVVVVGSGRCEE